MTAASVSPTPALRTIDILQFHWNEILEALGWFDAISQRSIPAALALMIPPSSALSQSPTAPCKCVARARAIAWLVSEGQSDCNDPLDANVLLEVLIERLAIVNRVGVDQTAVMRDVMCRLALDPARRA
jgi:hypothetical protein